MSDSKFYIGAQMLTSGMIIHYAGLDRQVESRYYTFEELKTMERDALSNPELRLSLGVKEALAILNQSLART